MGSHDPFGQLKQKLWPKERPKSNWQFDSRPLKVRERFDFLTCRWRVTYRWKALNKGYNFGLDLVSSSDLISIGVFHTKLWAPKVAKVPTSGISGFPLESPGTKWHLGVGPVTMHKVYYKGGRWWLLPSLGHGESSEFVFAHGSSVHQSAPTTH
jgi:hypothetical protein